MITAVVLAAGLSTRMGEQKLLLPWGKTSVIGHVVSTLIEAEVDNITLITGGSEAALKETLQDYEINYIFNRDYANGEMLLSVKAGLRSLGKKANAALIVLADQPQIEAKTIRAINKSYLTSEKKIIVPSYQMHRGHPWLVDNSFWQEILDLVPPLTLHNFLNKHSNDIEYVVVNTPSILQDLDTKMDYHHYSP